jgi:hypothetical protein
MCAYKQATSTAQQQESIAYARAKINLSVLKRHIPHVVNILDSASHSVLYEFEPATWEWVSAVMSMFRGATCSRSCARLLGVQTKKGVEGAMFLFERCDAIKSSATRFMAFSTNAFLSALLVRRDHDLAFSF